MPDIEQRYYIMAPIEAVWQALVDPKHLTAWGAGPAEMSESEGYKFSLWGGDIHGINVRVVKNEALEQEWISGKWDKPSRLKIQLRVEDNQVRVDLFQTGVPEEEYEKVAQGWKDYYFGPLKRWV